MKTIDKFISNTTMYRLITYYLSALLVVALGLSVLGILHFNPFYLIVSVVFLLVGSWITNAIFSWVFEAATSVESVYITALILALIINPIKDHHDFIFLFWAAVLSTASKYIIAINKKHIFNPAAFAVALTALTLGLSASWWVANVYMFVPVLIGGVLIVRKIKKFDMMWAFFLTVAVTIMGFSIFQGLDLISTTQKLLLLSPLFFFAFVMLTEPMTTPPTKKMQMIYGAIVGFLFVPQVHIGSFYFTPELALITGNVFSFAVSMKGKLQIRLKDKRQIADNTYEFIFETKRKISFSPGQYMEWTLSHKHPDSRGNRRFFTIASSPTEEDMKLGVKFYEPSSTFKKALIEMGKGDEIFAGQLAGNFVLPNDPNKKIALFAGGIGITPFRSMVKYLLDIKEKRDIVIFYANNCVGDIAYKEILDQAERELGIKVVYTLADIESIPSGWTGRRGFIDEKMIQEEMPDYGERMFYISGPPVMVSSYAKMLTKLGVKKGSIKTDYFPGF